MSGYKLVYTDVDGTKYYRGELDGSIYHRVAGRMVLASLTAEANVNATLRAERKVTP